MLIVDVPQWSPQLRPGGRLVIMDAKLSAGPAARLPLPFSVWLMKHTMLGNPFIRPWQELAAITEQFDMTEHLFRAYYICRGIKPEDEFTEIDIAHRIAAE